MRTAPIVGQLKAALPLFSNLFSESFNVTSLTSSGTTATVTTATANPFTTGEFVNISGAMTPVNITSLTFVNNVATAITATPHDLTENWPPYANIVIAGDGNDEFNGTFPLLTVPNRQTFTFQLPIVPTGPSSGSPQLLYQPNFSYNGFFPVTVINDTTFTYQLPSEQPNNAQGNIIALGMSRISRSATYERAVESYTKQTQAGTQGWIFVVAGAVLGNHDRQVSTDATAETSNGAMFWQRVIDSVDVYVFLPAINTIAAAQLRDMCEGPIFVALVKSILGVRFPTDFQCNNWSQLIFTGHDIQDYNTSYYVHRYSFEAQRDITYLDVVDPETVAFRDIALQFLESNGYNPVVDMTADINLDDVPL